MTSDYPIPKDTKAKIGCVTYWIRDELHKTGNSAILDAIMTDEAVATIARLKIKHKQEIKNALLSLDNKKLLLNMILPTVRTVHITNFLWMALCVLILNGK